MKTGHSAAPTEISAAISSRNGVQRAGRLARAKKKWLAQKSIVTVSLDLAFLPLIYPAGLLLRNVRRIGFKLLPRCRNALISIGVVPIGNHYYEPLIDAASLKHSLWMDRDLPAIDWNVGAQLELLDQFRFNDELRNFPENKLDEWAFFYNNRFFESGDAEYWYNIIRTLKPKRIFEIGSGNSTLMAAAAIRINTQDDPNYTCKHVCIEPYENGWLEELGIEVVREKVEEVDVQFFGELEENDILFIDSSHIIRPQGDVLFEYLKLLPLLARGVVVHVHDIFSPKDYPEEWLVDEVRLWNEQYLLEAFLSHNRDWEIIGALNYLKHNHYDALQDKCPYLTPDREPASFYIRKVN